MTSPCSHSRSSASLRCCNSPRASSSTSKIRFENKNALVGRYRGAFGLKTGYTARAGKCLIAYAKRGDSTVLLVLLHGNDRWWDAVDILDVAFAEAQRKQ